MTESKDKSGPPGVTPGGKTVAEALGEIVWLMTQSPVHKQLFVGDLEWFCMPPVLLEQFRIFRGPNSPAAVAFWAFLSEETEARMSAGGVKLRVDEWKKGDRAWLIELVAPFGATDEIMRDLSVNVFGSKPFKYHRVGPDGRRVVATFDPPTP